MCCVSFRSCFVLKDGLDSSHGSFISSSPQPVGVGALRAGGLLAAEAIRLRTSASPASGGAAAARCPTPPAATSRSRASPSTTAGRASKNCRRSRPRCQVDATRKIITRNESPDISFDRSINPYRGCEHGCVYCFARPTHAYLGLSPGLDFESKLFVKPDAPALLERNCRRRTISRAPSRSAPTPIRISRSSASTR